MRVHVSPPFSERKTPPVLLRRSSSAPIPPSLLCTTAITTFGSLALTAKPIRPVCPGRPPPSFFQVPPPSVLLKIPPTSSPPVTLGPEAKLHGVRWRAYSAA